MMKNKLIVSTLVFSILAGAYLAAGPILRGRMEAELTTLCRRPVTVRSAYVVFPPAVRLVGVDLPAVQGQARIPVRIRSLVIRPWGRTKERRFTVSGDWLTGQEGLLGSFDGKGTYLREGPVDADVTLTCGNLVALASYLREGLGSAPSAGRMRMETHLTVHMGVLMAHNEVTAAGVVFPGNAPTTLGLDGNRLVELLRDPEGKVHLSFIVSGKLGEKLNWSDLTAGAMREAMRQAMSRSIQRVLNETEQKKPVEELLRNKLDSLDR